jgi:inner membrane protein
VAEEIKSKRIKTNSATMKVLAIGLLVLVLLIPMFMVSDLMYEREQRHDDVVREISEKWGARQTITGPFLTIPYKQYYKDEDKTLKYLIRHIYVLPQHLNIEGDMTPHIRYRSIYEAVLYNTKLSFSGHFVLPQTHLLNVDGDHILWDKATLSVGLSDMIGIQDNITIHLNDQVYRVSSGLPTTAIARSGISSAVQLKESKKKYTFSLAMNLNGSEQLRFIPIAEETNVKLRSSWASPSFNGSFLPVLREVSEQGFSASWKVLHLNRNFPQYWQNDAHRVGDSFGVKLFITANVYQKAERVAKYAVLFILFTFLAFFFSEIINKKPVHPIQYLLIGLAIIIFYVLLVSLSEHINFDLAYWVSAIAVTLMITGYAQGIIKSKRFTWMLFSILVVLYGFIYTLLQLEDYALLLGSLGLFSVLGIVMYFTRQVDWYGFESH